MQRLLLHQWRCIAVDHNTIFPQKETYHPLKFLWELGSIIQRRIVLFRVLDKEKKVEGFLYYVVVHLEFLCIQQTAPTLSDQILWHCSHLYYNEQDGWYRKHPQGDRWYSPLEKGTPTSPTMGVPFHSMLGYTSQARRDSEMNRRYNALIAELKKRDLV